MHTVTSTELENQFSVICSILECKGFNTGQIKYMETILNKVSADRHKYIVKAFKVCKVDEEKYYMPMEIPGRKLEQMVFTKRKMRTKLCF